MVAEQADIYRGPRIDDYETPDWIWKPLNDQYHFTVDLAANAYNAKTPLWRGRGTEICTPWLGVAWLNPPFSKADEFFTALWERANEGHEAIAIYKLGNMETAVWRTIFSSCSWIAIPHRRVQYLLDGKPVRATSGKRAGKRSSCQFASAVVGFNVPKPKGFGAKEGMWLHTILEVAR